MAKTKNQRGNTTAISIIIFGVIIAGAIVLSSNQNGETASLTNSNSGHSDTSSANENNGLRPITDEDHIRGDINAPITIVEFSDLECPFCRRLHPTLARIVEENSDVKWVYRHFPLTSIHSRAQQAAVASECIAKLGGNDSFWTFVDRVFNNQNRLGSTLYTEIASDFGIGENEFKQCTSSREIAREVTADFNEARALGGSGTPYSLVISEAGNVIPMSGALPYEQIVQVINRARLN